MLGHVLCRECAGRLDTYGTLRGDPSRWTGGGRIEAGRLIGGVVAEKPESVRGALERTSPHVVVNCIGIVKQSAAAQDAARMVEVNSVFPHRLARICSERDVRLIHISTDCVFSGRRGAYDELDLPDPADLYGRSKLAGEPEGPGTLTLRTSMIGWELETQRGLLEWFASRDGETVKGFRHAVFSGPTAPELARLIARIADECPELDGHFHAGAAPISKHELLVELRRALDLEIDIEAADEPRIDRSLDSSKLHDAIAWKPPPWDEMVAELARERRND